MIRRDNEGNLIWSLDDPDDIEDLSKEVLSPQCEIGQRFAKDYYVASRKEEIRELWVRTMKQLAKSTTVTLVVAIHSLRLLMDSGAIPLRDSTTPEVLAEPVPEPEVLRDRNNKPLGPQQLKWREFLIFVNGDGKDIKPASMEQVHARRRSDAEFQKFYSHQNREALAESQAQVQDAVIPEGQRTGKPTEAGAALATFVKAFHATPVSKLKPIQGMVQLGDEQVSVEVFNGLLTRAKNAGLL